MGNKKDKKIIGRFKPKDLEKLRRIIQQDYGVALSEEEVDQLGFSLLKITRLAMSAFNREEEKQLTIKT